MNPHVLIAIERNPFKTAHAPFSERFSISHSEPSLHKLPRFDCTADEMSMSSRGQFVQTMETTCGYSSWGETTPQRVAFERTLIDGERNNAENEVGQSKRAASNALVFLRCCRTRPCNILLCATCDAVRSRASTNLRATFGQQHADEGQRLNAAGRPTTRCHLLAMRREAMEADNAALAARSSKPTLPVTNAPTCRLRAHVHGGRETRTSTRLCSHADRRTRSCALVCAHTALWPTAGGSSSRRAGQEPRRNAVHGVRRDAHQADGWAGLHVFAAEVNGRGAID
jgi:hypothetical protein